MDLADQLIYGGCWAILAAYLAVTLAIFFRRSSCALYALSYLLACLLWLALCLFNLWFLFPAFLRHLQLLPGNSDHHPPSSSSSYPHNSNITTYPDTHAYTYTDNTHTSDGRTSAVYGVARAALDLAVAGDLALMCLGWAASALSLANATAMWRAEGRCEGCSRAWGRRLWPELEAGEKKEKKKKKRGGVDGDGGDGTGSKFLRHCMVARAVVLLAVVVESIVDISVDDTLLWLQQRQQQKQRLRRHLMTNMAGPQDEKTKMPQSGYILPITEVTQAQRWAMPDNKQMIMTAADCKARRYYAAPSSHARSSPSPSLSPATYAILHLFASLFVFPRFVYWLIPKPSTWWGEKGGEEEDGEKENEKTREEEKEVRRDRELDLEMGMGSG